MKTFRCVPIAIGLPAVFIAYFFICLGITYSCLMDNDIGGVILFAFFALLALSFMMYTFIPGIQRVQISPEKIICKGILQRQTFEIEYAKCNVGMDYHLQNGNQIWWIYLCYGNPPQYKGNNPSNRINTIKIRPGFVKIMYSDEVCDTLITVLPKKQKTSLITARRCAGFEKQGRIV